MSTDEQATAPERRVFASSLAIALLVAAAAATALSVRLSHPRLDVDEITYVRSVLESLRTGSVLPLHFGRPFFNKPPLALWLIRASFQWLGPTPFAARLPSVLAVAATAGLVCWLGAVWRSRVVGLLAALLFLMVPGALSRHSYRNATPDALEILVVTVAIACLELWRLHRRPAAAWGCLAALAATAWVKSPFAGVVIVAYLLASELLLRRHRRETHRFPALVATSVAVWLGAVVLWLAVLAAETSPQRVARRLLHEQYARRIEGRLAASHLQGPGFYPTVLWQDFGWLVLVPILAPAALRLSRRQVEVDTTRRGALAVWALAAPLLASASASKQPWYVYLSYPGLALLVAWDVERLARTAIGSRPARAAVLGAVVAWAGWRLPARQIWPASPQHRGPTACLYELHTQGLRLIEAAREPRRAPRRPAHRERGQEVREALLFVNAVLWQQSREPATAARCIGRLSNEARAGAVSLLPPFPHDDGRGIFLVDDCGGRVRERLLAPECGATMAAGPQVPRAGPGRPRRDRK